MVVGMEFLKIIFDDFLCNICFQSIRTFKKKSVRPELVKDWILSSAASKQSKKNGTKMFLKKLN